MPVGLVRIRRGSPHLTSPGNGAHYGISRSSSFVRRYAASLAGSAYYPNSWAHNKHMNDVVQQRPLTAADTSLLETFLALHRDSSMFLRANVRRAGLTY